MTGGGSMPAVGTGPGRCDDADVHKDAPDRDDAPVPVGRLERVALLLRVWTLAARIQLALARHPVAVVADAVGRIGDERPKPIRLLNRAVSRGLRVGDLQPRCLTRSLVLYALLRSQGDPAELVIGLKAEPGTADAHAWVELRGEDVGPLPGSRGYRAMARYPRLRGTSAG